MISDRLPLGTKGCVPRLPDPLVERLRLEKVLSDGERRPVTLVSGPPGAGKTTLLASWLLRSSLPGSTAWLSLDGQDNQSGRLAALVPAVLADAGCVDPGVAEASDRPLDAALEDIRLRARPCVLALDDVQELSSRSALDALAHLVERTPAQLDVVLFGRIRRSGSSACASTVAWPRCGTRTCASPRSRRRNCSPPTVWS